MTPQTPQDKQIRIDKELFFDICSFFFSSEAPKNDFTDGIRKGLEDKLDKIVSRMLFTKYKRTPSGEEREKARKDYLTHRGIPKDYADDVEMHEP